MSPAYSRFACTSGMAYAPQAPALHVMRRAIYAASSETACNDSMAYASQATELHVTRVWHILIQAPEPHVTMT